MSSRLCAWSVTLAMTAALSGAARAAGTPPPQQPDLPPLSWTCPMHPDVVDGEPGSCPVCKMDLVAIRLDLAWTCPLHGVVMERAAGACPICARDLVRVTVALTWSCPTHPEIAEIGPGTCPICKMELAPTSSARAHGDHNPRHGGLFFMAPDNWHHLEGTYPEPGLFRVHVYDDYTRPLGVEDVLGRAVLVEQLDPVTKATRELSAVPLQSGPGGEYLEGRIDRLPLPARITAKLRFEPDGPEHRFDFTFETHSREPTPGAPAVSTVLRQTSAIPEAPGDIFQALIVRAARLDDLVERGVLSEVYIPALEAKDLALALDEHRDTVPASRRATLGFAVKRLVRASWLLDTYGDLGDRQQVAGAHAMFAAAVAEIREAFGAP